MAKKTAVTTVPNVPKAEIIKPYALSDSYTGSPEVPVALLTSLIAYLT